jgi:hypothetical protein
MGKLLVAPLVAILLASQARHGDADGLEVVSGKLVKDHYGFVNQTLSVKNGSAADIEVVHLECSFVRENRLVATGIGNLKNLKSGGTGDMAVVARLTVIPDHTDCRAF